MEGAQFWWGVVAFVLGGVATQLNGWNDRRRQRRERREALDNAKRERRQD
ncbi:hypothetical protein [Streptomyces sp. NPDC002685]